MTRHVRRGGDCPECGGYITIATVGKGIRSYRCLCHCLVVYPNGIHKRIDKTDYDPKLAQQKYKERYTEKVVSKRIGKMAVIKDDRTG